jgi:hypothetical protein
LENPSAAALDAQELSLLAGYGGAAPLFARLPIPYRLVPLHVRTALLGAKYRLEARRVEGTAFPAWPIESSVDRQRASGWERATAEAGVPLERPAWPEGRRAAFLLTHDVDSRPELGLIAALRDAEHVRGLPSAVGFVPRISWPTQAYAEDMVANGAELYCHDIGHDGRLPTLSAAEAVGAFATVFEASPWAQRLMRGFRSGQLLMSPDLRTAVGETFDYDMSLPDTERGGAYGFSAGCATVFPFAIGPLLEIPLTLPQDVFLLQVHRLSPERALACWLRKIEYIVSVGGVAVLNVHPVWVNPSRQRMWDAYVRLLDAVAADERLWVTTPARLAQWLDQLRYGSAADE